MSRGDALFVPATDPAVVHHRRAAVEWSREHPRHLLFLIEPMGPFVAGEPECSWCDCPDERHISGSGNLTVVFTGDAVCLPELECHERSTHVLFIIDGGEILSRSGSYPMLCLRHLRPAVEFNVRGARDMTGYDPEVRVYGEPDE